MMRKVAVAARGAGRLRGAQSVVVLHRLPPKSLRPVHTPRRLASGVGHCPHPRRVQTAYLGDLQAPGEGPLQGPQGPRAGGQGPEPAPVIGIGSAGRIDSVDPDAAPAPPGLPLQRRRKLTGPAHPRRPLNRPAGACCRNYHRQTGSQTVTTQLAMPSSPPAAGAFEMTCRVSAGAADAAVADSAARAKTKAAPTVSVRRMTFFGQSICVVIGDTVHAAWPRCRPECSSNGSRRHAHHLPCDQRRVPPRVPPRLIRRSPE